MLGGLGDDGEGGCRVVIILAGHLQVLQVVLDIIQIVMIVDTNKMSSPPAAACTAAASGWV